MKKILGGLAVTALLAGPAMAADMPARVMKAPAMAPVVAPVFNWTGIYIGAHGGWGRGDIDAVGLNPLGVPDPAFGVVSGRVDGFVAGGHIGFNWQISQIVLGAEVAGSWAELDGSTLCPNPGFTCHAEIDRLFRAGGRLGFAVNNWLIYGMGGWARARVATTATPFFFGFNDRHHHDGWYAGGGVEFGFAQNWIFGVEGFRVELDHENHAFPPFIGGASRRVDGDFWVIQGRLSYKFGFGGPVVARY